VTRLLVLAEGDSEELFVRELLAPHLIRFGIYASALVITPPADLGAQSAQHMRDTARAVSRGGGLGGFMIKAGNIHGAPSRVRPSR